MFHGGKPWVADHQHPHYQAAKNAMLKGFFIFLYFLNKINLFKVILFILVFNVEPDFTREGLT